MERTKVQQEVYRDRWSISRMPEWAKQIIIDRSELEHCGDYGQCIAQFVREANEYNSLKNKFFNNKLDVNLMINDKYSERAKEESSVKTANGRVIKGGNK